MTIPGEAADYADRVARHVPGLHDLHRMTGILLAESVPAGGQVLVLGAGGGMELRALALARPDWRFLGIDPSEQMLAQARRHLGAEGGHIRLHQGYIDDAPEGPFDGATCLLTLHFLPPDDRLRSLRALHRRLRPGASFVMAHHSFPLEAGQQDLWLHRNASWLMAGGVSEAQAKAGIATMRERLPVLPPEDEVALLYLAGFSRIELFYAAFTFKGWVARA